MLGLERMGRALTGARFGAIGALLLAGSAGGAYADTITSELDTSGENTIYVRYDAAASAARSSSTGESGWFVYDIRISGGTEIRDVTGPATTYVTLYDFAGMIGSPEFTMNVPMQTAGFTAVVGTPSLGVTPAGLSPSADSAGIPNITIGFNHDSASALYTTAAESSIGTLMVRSQYTGLNVLEDNVASYDYRTRNGVTRVNQHLTDATVPYAVVPVPAAVWGGAGLLGLVGAARLRRSRQLTTVDGL